MNHRKPITRRSSLARIGLAGTAATLGKPSGASAEPYSGKATAFALVGDRYHNSDYIRTSLKKTLVEGAGLSIDFTDEVTLLNADTLKNYRMLIVFRDGMLWPNGYGSSGSYPGMGANTPEEVNVPPVPVMETKTVMWLTTDQGRAVREFVTNGGSAFFFHNNSHVSLASEDYRDVEGAVYTGHPPVRPFWVRIVDNSHPITRGVKDFLVTDEQHYVTYDKDPKHVLMRSENADGLSYGEQGASCEAGWAYDYGRGRVVFMAPGHTINAMWNPEYVKLQQNAVRWLLRET